MKPKQDAMRVTFSFSPAQDAAVEVYRLRGWAKDRSKAMRAVMRAGLEALAAGAATERERKAAAAALEVWHEWQPEHHQSIPDDPTDDQAEEDED